LKEFSLLKTGSGLQNYSILFRENQKSPTVNNPLAEINTIDIISYIFKILNLKSRPEGNYTNREMQNACQNISYVSIVKSRTSIL
jgi:hypothetical protein